MGNMARNKSETCIFCLIANDQDKETEIIKKNKELVCFRDIDPAAPHHYLVVPIQHIHSCLSLHSGHIGLVKRMAEMGKTVLHDQGVTDMKDIRFLLHETAHPAGISCNWSWHPVPVRDIAQGHCKAFTTSTFYFVARLGFHQPPFTSVDHLHLHVLAPSSQISECMQYKFIPRTNRFVTNVSRSV
ncbi:adenosine 5'-monophosphoramidase HINT3-like isoform X2 [Sander vitreus]